jgi:hypothetical protein
MDLDSDYYSSRCKDINGLWVFQGTFMTFVGGDSDHYTLFYFNIRSCLQFWGGDALTYLYGCAGGQGFVLHFSDILACVVRILIPRGILH